MRGFAPAFACAFIVFLGGAWWANAQQPKQPDPAILQMQLEETHFLLAQRRDQAAKAEKAIEQMTSERDYWKSYAGFGVKK